MSTKQFLKELVYLTTKWPDDMDQIKRICSLLGFGPLGCKVECVEVVLMSKCGQESQRLKMSSDSNYMFASPDGLLGRRNVAVARPGDSLYVHFGRGMPDWLVDDFKTKDLHTVLLHLSDGTVHSQVFEHMPVEYLQIDIKV